MSKAYLRSVAVVTNGERSTIDDLMIQVRPHEAVNADHLGVSPAEQKRMRRALDGPEISASMLPRVGRGRKAA